MKFEYLPNEILFQCFEYLNGIDIYYAFDQLNYRFNKLIRSILLSVNFQHIRRLALENFCMKILLNDEIKNQIYSLHLSNKNSSINIQMFLSNFSLEKFIYLRSLTLTDVIQNDISKLKLMLPLISQLSSFRLIDCDDKSDELLSVLPMTQIRILMISTTPLDIDLLNKFSMITSLTISNCEFITFSKILTNTNKLIYLRVECLIRSRYSLINEDIYLPNLKYFIIICFYVGFEDIMMILKQTPNLKNLIISNYNNETMINANQWEQLITSSLLYLNIFKFKFYCSRSKAKFNILENFHDFQGHFWCKQHNWFIEYTLSNDSLLIYTIPYISDSFELTLDTNRYSNEITNNINVFSNVKNLIIDSGVITNKCQYYFSHILSLTLQKPWSWSGEEFFQIKHIEQLKMIVNLSNIKHITISHTIQFQTTDVLIELLNQSSQILSLKIDPNELISLFNDDRLCKYLNNMIKILDIHMIGESSLNNSSGLKQFCKVFSNLEQLICTINQRETLIILFQHLSQLSFLKVFYSRPSTYQNYISNLEEEAQKLKIKIITQFNNNHNPNLSIWIIRNIY